MLIKRTADCNEFTANDGCAIREVLHPDSDGVELPMSFAVGRVSPGEKTHAHYLEPVEVYYILRGRGLMHVGDESGEIGAGDVVHVPARASQWLENLGDAELVFLVVCAPAWYAAGDVLL